MSKAKPQPKVETPPPPVSAGVREVQIHYIILGVALAITLALSWRCWPDPIVDFGHELYIPWRLSVGDVPYLQIDLVTGPASQLYHAALFQSFGTSFSVLIVANILTLVLLIALLYDSLANLSSRWVAFMAALFFVTVFSCGQYTAVGNYNYISPYRHELTHGIVAGILGLWSLRRAGLTSLNRWFFMTGLFCGVTIALKTEVGLPLLGALAWWGAVSFRKTSVMTILTRKFSLLAGMVIPLAFCWIELQVRGLSPNQAWESLFAAWNYSFRPDLTRNSSFYAYVIGWNNLSQRIVDAIATITIASVVLAALAWLDRWTSSSNVSVGVRRVTSVVMGVLLFLLGQNLHVWNNLIPTLPLFLLLVIATSTLRLFQPSRSSSPDRFEHWRTWGLWATYAFLCSLKMLFYLIIAHYGFVLAMPATMLGILILLHLLPQSLGLYSPSLDFAKNPRQAPGRLWKTVIVCFLFGGMVGHFATSARIWMAKETTLGTFGDYFRGENHSDRRILAIRKAYDFLRSEMSPNDTLAVIPDGTMLNYQLRKKNPTPHIMLGPWDIMAAGGDPIVTAAFRKSPPDWIVVTSEDVGIHGTGHFGSESYGPKLAAWIQRNYVNAKIIHETSRLFGAYSVSIVKRRSPSVLPVATE